MKDDQNYRDEVFTELAAERTLEEILNPKLTPDILEMLLRLKNPKPYEWVTDGVAKRLSVFGEPGYQQYREVVNGHFWNTKMPNETKREIKRMVAAAAELKNGTIDSRSQRASDYLASPPEKRPYQHEKIMSRSGVTVLAGRPKMGKSYLALDLSLAIANGGMFASYFHMEYPGDVLYLALEDDASRMWARIQALAGGDGNIPSNLWLDYSAPNLYGGRLVEEIKEWAKNKAACPRLVVIDIFGLVQSPKGQNSDLYAHEYNDMAQLSSLSRELDLHTVIVTHLNKSYSNAMDIMDSVMSSTAITGGASAIWVLSHRGEEIVDAELHITGKDVPRWTCALESVELDGHKTWKALGDIDSVIQGETQRDVVLALYRWEGANPTQTELREAVCEGMDKGNFSRLLKRLRTDGLLRMERNKYGLTQQGASTAEIYAGETPF